MDLQKKSELSVGRGSSVISTELVGDAEPSIETRVVGSDGSVVFQTSQDISALKPIFQNSQKVFARLEAQHHAVVKELEQGRIGEAAGEAASGSSGIGDRESDALAHTVGLLGSRTFDKAIAALRAVLETYPNCSEARQLLVLLATTWSPERRQQYAAEILAPATRLLSAGRPEEAQALLLVTQTVEGAPVRQTDETSLSATISPSTSPTSPTSPTSEDTLIQQELEDLVPEAIENPPGEKDELETLVTQKPQPRVAAAA